MTSSLARSNLRFEKHRAPARVTLTGGGRYDGCFFVAGGAARHDGPERVADLLESAEGFVPFETTGAGGTETRVVNPTHIVAIALGDDEASRDPAYVIGRRQPVAVRLSTGDLLIGVIRVTRPEGHDRLSDWTRQPDRFRYVETSDALMLVNSAHIVEVAEIPET